MSVIATHPAGLVPVGFQQLTVSDTVLGLTVPAGAVRAVVDVESQPIRYRVDGQYPTGDIGHLVKADVVFELHTALVLKSFRVIRDGSSDGILNITYFGDMGQIVLQTSTTTTTTTAATTTTTTGE